jgi:adenine phosphoribosyltransferase
LILRIEKGLALQLVDALALIRPVPDFPIAGILFQDITPLLANAQAFALVINELCPSAKSADCVAGIEARGFMLASAIAIKSNIGFVPIRKQGKLPGPVIRREYGLEYGSDSLEMQVDALTHVSAPRVLLIDDVLATGGTLVAALELIADLAGEICEVAVLLEISALGGRERILAAFPELKIRALVQI